MVLDAKALTWAAQNNIDTAKLKAAKIPIYGKWYFPELPAGVALVNLETGEGRVFKERMIAGEVIWAPEEDLRKAGLLPESFVGAPAEPEPGPTGLAPARAPAPEPLLAVARPVGVERETTRALVPVEDEEPEPDDPSIVASIHMPKASIAPFVLGVGFCIVLLGVISSAFIVVVGLLWMLVGAIGWVRIGMLELAAGGHGHEADH